MRVLLSGGGTGGHVYPILAAVSALRVLSKKRRQDRLTGQSHGGGGALPAGSGEPSAARAASEGRLPPPSETGARFDGEAGYAAGSEEHLNDFDTDPELELRYVGEAGGIEEELAGRAGIPFESVATGQMRGRAPWVAARNALRMAQGARQCAALLRAYRPDVILVTGGYVTVPLALAAQGRAGQRRVPLLIYLPDLTPGLAVRWTSRLAARVAVSFPEVTQYFPGKAVVTGYPVRPELLAADKDSARAALGVGQASGAPVVLVFGGSRGARSINRALVDALPQVLPRCEVLHVSGQLDWPWVAEAAGKLPPGLRERYHPFPYLHDEMMQALAAADLAVARAGASTLGEFPARGLPSILAPYPYAGQHQQDNAEYLAQRGAALIVQDEELSVRLAPTLLELIEDRARLAKMGQAATALARPEAAFDLARLLYQLAGK